MNGAYSSYIFQVLEVDVSGEVRWKEINGGIKAFYVSNLINFNILEEKLPFHDIKFHPSVVVSNLF
jgi:hypothetical protein